MSNKMLNNPLHTPQSRRRAIAGTTIGNALEFFDFTVFSFLMLVLGPLFFPQASGYGQLLLTTATYGAGFLMRPVGGMLIGSYADRYGRRSAMTLTLALMGLGCGMIAFAPTYAQADWLGPVILVFARLIQGFAAGGEVGASTTLLVEYAPAARRGYFSSWQFGSQSLGVMFGALIVAGLTYALSTDQMQAWGWRVPFILGMLTVPVGLYIRKNLEETLALDTQVADKTTAKHQPVRQVLSQHYGLVLTGMLLMIGGMTCTQIISFYMPAYAHKTLGLPATASLLASVALGVIGFTCAPFIGMLADRIGRKKVIFWSRLLTIPSVLFGFSHLLTAPSVLNLMLLISWLALLLTFQVTPAITMLPELFPKEVRTTGVAIVYGFGVSVFGGFSQFFVTWLLKATDNPMSLAWYLVVTLLLSTLVLFWIKDRTGQQIDG